MNLREFLFTDKAPGKYYRHIAFWMSTYVPFMVMGIMALFSKYTEKGFTFLLQALLSRSDHLVIDIGYTYAIAYWLLPAYRRNRKPAPLITGIVALTVVAFAGKALFWYSDTNPLHYYPDDRLLSTWYLIVNFFNDGCLTRCGLFLICKMLKSYYARSEERVNLLNENATAELQLLKAQVHPHFLFNTLNNIYSFSLQRSPLAASLVLKLSDTLRYMINECEAPLVSLEKELKILKDYIGLESVRYGSRLEVLIVVNGSAENKMIAPLLLIPLVENSFKHGTSQMLDKPWINLDIVIYETTLEFRLTNSKPPGENQREGRNGIGLKNVQKRLSLLYPLQHKFIVNPSVDSYEIILHMPLHPDHASNQVVDQQMYKKLNLA